MSKISVKSKNSDDDSEPKKTTKSKTPAWMKKGAAAQEAMEVAEAQSKFTPKFFMGVDEDASITFLDGAIDPETGLIDMCAFHMHTIQVGGRWKDFICVGEVEPCPICEGGDKPSFVAAFTVIDHRTIKTQQGTFKDRKVLFIPKRTTIKTLQKLAQKNKGLRGLQVEISRTTKQAPSVGDVYVPEKKYTEQELVDAFKDTEPYDYGQEIKYFTAKQLLKQGVGNHTKVIGAESDDDDDNEDMESEL